MSREEDYHLDATKVSGAVPVQDDEAVQETGLRRCPISKLLVLSYRLCRRKILRRLVFRLALSYENGPYYSATIREILSRCHGVRIGAYSYGQCMEPGAFPTGVTVGRYVSIAGGVKVVLNHPVDRLSTHPFFFNRALGVIKKDNFEHNTLYIGHDAWIGASALITAGCKRIGIGAVVGAGAVVTKDVPDFAIVIGVPAKIIRYRFEENICSRIKESRWWEESMEELTPHLRDFCNPLAEPDGTSSSGKFAGAFDREKRL